MSPRLLALGAGVLAACAAVPLWSALWGERVVFWRDVHLLWLPQVDVVARTLAEGAWPVWDRFSGFGRPLLADPRAALFYPPTWLGVLAPPGVAYAWLSAFHLFVAGGGTALLARRLGGSPPAALLAGALLVAAGPLLSLVLMWHQLAAFAWAPLVLWAFHRLAAAPDRRGLALAAALFALQALAGSPEYSALTALAVAVLCAPLRPRRAGLRTLGALAVAGLLGVGVAAAQWLPAAHYAAGAARLQRAPDPANWALAPPLFAEFGLGLRAVDLPLSAAASAALLGGREPLLHSLYLGPVAVVLALAALAGAGGTGWRLAALALTAALVALGPHAPLLELLQALVPPLSGLRYPAKAAAFVALAVALLAAAGFDRLARGEEAARRAARHAGYAAAALCALVATGPWPRAWLRDPAALATVGRAALLAAALALAAAALGRLAQRRGPRAVLALLVVLPPLAQHRALLETAPASLFTTRPELLRHLAPASTGRIYAYDYLVVNEWQRLASPHAPTALVTVRAPLGYGPGAAFVAAAHAALHPPTGGRFGLAGSYDYDVLDFEPVERFGLATWLRASEASPAHLKLLRMAAVTHAVGIGPARWWQGLRPTALVPGLGREPITLLEVPDPLPRARVVGAVRVASGEAALGAVRAADFDPRVAAVLSPEDAARAGVPSGPFEGHAEIAALRGDRVELDVTLSRAGLVVLADAWDAGWQASVDGAPAPVLKADVAFRAVPLSAGRHRVRLRYVPPGLAAGAAISGLAALVLIALGRRR
jgi:hypothetical protein